MAGMDKKEVKLHNRYEVSDSKKLNSAIYTLSKFNACTLTRTYKNMQLRCNTTCKQR